MISKTFMSAANALRQANRMGVRPGIFYIATARLVELSPKSQVTKPSLSLRRFGSSSDYYFSRRKYNTTTKNDFKVSVSIDSTILSTLSNDDDLIGSIDQGTSSSRFMIFTSLGKVLGSAQVEFTQIYPPGDDFTGWHEHDPMEMWSSTKTCIHALQEALKSSDLNLSSLKALGITNQRETTIAWNARTGMPYYNAIVWDDLRTADIATKIASEGPILPHSDANHAPYTEPSDRIRARTGLPLASYFAGTKVRWLLDNVPQLSKDLEVGSPERDNVRFGTVDTWLMHQLTGSPSPSGNNTGGLFLTDVTNASRWLFMNIDTLEWDPEMVRIVCGEHDVPLSALPEIRASSEVYGVCSGGVECLEGVPIASILGDQQAALFGQSAYQAGDAKCTYGTGVFLLMNTGKYVPSFNGLLSTPAYKLGPAFGNQVVYALEGSVSHSGSVIQWLRDQLQIINSAPEVETYAKEVSTNDGLYFVPAFAGLFAPYWRSDARGCIVGMTASHNKRHICRAALEATAYQVRDLLDAIYRDSGTELKGLKVDGGATKNDVLMQFQADMVEVPVMKPEVTETTALGAAFAAGLAVGVWKSLDEIKISWAQDKSWSPSMDQQEREKYRSGWKKAVNKSFGWIEN